MRIAGNGKGRHRLLQTASKLSSQHTLTLGTVGFLNRDAEDAVAGRDGYDFHGNRLRVELSRGARGAPPVTSNQEFRGRGSAFRCVVKGLPISASWQDLKV